MAVAMDLLENPDEVECAATTSGRTGGAATVEQHKC